MKNYDTNRFSGSSSSPPEAAEASAMDWEIMIPDSSGLSKKRKNEKALRGHTVSPSLELAPSFEEWQTENAWDEIVLLGDDDHECHFDDSAFVPKSFLLDPALVGFPESVPSVDEFLVGHTSDNIEIELGNLDAPELPPPPPSSSDDTDTQDSPRNFEELYRKTLTKLKASMKRTRESRKCLHAIFPQTKKYARRNSISQVLHKVENSSRQIDTYLNPDAFQRRDTL